MFAKALNVVFICCCFLIEAWIKQICYVQSITEAIVMITVPLSSIHSRDCFNQIRKLDIQNLSESI